MSPVGSPTCPYCDRRIVLDVPLPFGRTTCLHCGEQVWFLTVCSTLSFFRYQAAGLVRQLFDGLSDEQRLPHGLQFDALDKVELVMAFEEALEEAS